MAQPHLHKTSEASSRVNVVKPTPKADTTVPKKGSILSPGGDKLFSSKYLGTSVVSNARNLGYSGTIILGDNPPQEFEVVFDTGSDMIVVTSDQCQGTHCNDMAHYKCVTCQKTPYSYNITYGDGTWGNGPIVTDTVSIGGLVVKDQQILDIVQSGLDLSSYGSGISGLVGLMPSSPVMNAIPPLATIFKDKLLDMNVFSVYLAPSLKTRQGGSFLFGGIDRTKFVGELNQVPLSTAPGVREGMWYIDADGAFIGSTPVSGYKTSPWLFDTGTSFIAVPTSFAAAFHENIPGSSFSDVDKIYSVPCTGNWTFGVSFNGTKYEIPYLDYIAFADKAAKLCVSLVMPLGDYEMFILGDPFLRQVYAVYDFTPGASRIGLAAVNVTNNFLGNEGLSGDPVPGGSVIGGKQVSGAAASLLSSMFRTTTTNMAVALCVVAAMMAMSV
ncbi:hypothetical protein BGX31_011222 [Mortierella sp. GBA43]|nr:hypothetical protein BGX31_011222 [Mortierella sp. GBA43]